MKKNYKLKELRGLNNMSQMDLALKLDLSESTYNQKENGIRDFTETEIRKIIDIFECSADEVFFNKKVAKTTTKERGI